MRLFRRIAMGRKPDFARCFPAVLAEGEDSRQVRRRGRALTEGRCNSADSSPVYVLRPGASGRVSTGRLDRTRVSPGNQGGEERRRLQRGLQQACNLLATSLQPRKHSGITPVVLCLGPVPVTGARYCRLTLPSPTDTLRREGSMAGSHFSLARATAINGWRFKKECLPVAG